MQCRPQAIAEPSPDLLPSTTPESSSASCLSLGSHGSWQQLPETTLPRCSRGQALS